jgi:hypothetical protein
MKNSLLRQGIQSLQYVEDFSHLNSGNLHENQDYEIQQVLPLNKHELLYVNLLLEKNKAELGNLYKDKKADLLMACVFAVKV